MKVLCIDSTPNEDEFEGETPIEGRDYTVLYEIPGIGTTGKTVNCYVLAELQKQGFAYDQRKFIPISDIDETVRLNKLCPASI